MHTDFVDVQRGMILGTKCQTWLSTTPEISEKFDVFEVPKDTKLLVLEEIKTWVKVLVVGENKTGWLEKNADDFAFFVFASAPV